jgi:hypothetical protein
MTLQTGGTNSTLYINSKGTGFISLGTNSNTRVFISSAGNVGIGTDGPAAPLHIKAPYGDAALSPVLGATTNSAFLLTSSASAYGLNIVGSNTGAVHFQSQYFDGNTNSLAITLNPMGGNVGIGTTAPGSKLSVYGATNIIALVNPSTSTNFMSFVSNGTTYGYIGLDNSSGGGLFGSGVAYGLCVGSPSATPLSFATSNIIRMTVAVGGNVGIGIAPTNTFHIANGDSTQMYFTNIQSSKTYQVGVDAAGAFIIYTVASSGTIGGQGVYLANAGTSWNGNSDARLKTNVSTISSALSSITQLRPVTFNYIADASSTIMRSGFIAQEVDTVFPKESTWITSLNKGQTYIDANGNPFNPLGISQTEMIPYIVRSIQELAEENTLCKQQIATQQTQITAQQTEITSLQTQLSNIIQRLASAGIA